MHTLNTMIMKKAWVFISVLLWIGSTQSCKKLDKLTEFDIVYHTEITISTGIPVNLPFDIPTPAIETNSEEEFENNNTHKDLIEKIYLKKMELTITDPANGTFDFLNSIEIYIVADGLPEKKIAWKNPVPSNIGNTLRLETTGDDLQDYIKKDSFRLKTKVVTDQILSQDYDIDIQSVFRVNAKILGI